MQKDDTSITQDSLLEMDFESIGKNKNKNKVIVSCLTLSTLKSAFQSSKNYFNLNRKKNEVKAENNNMNFDITFVERIVNNETFF